MAHLYSLLATEAGGSGLEQILPYLPIALAVLCGVILLIAFIVGLKKGGRRVSWTGFIWLATALAFCLLQQFVGQDFSNMLAPYLSPLLQGLPLTGETLTAVSDSALKFLPPFILALACILVMLVLYGIFSLVFRPKLRSVRKNSDAYTMDENGFEYDEDYEDYDDYEDYTSRRAPVRVNYGTPKLIGRLAGGLLCVINAAMVLATVLSIGLFIINATPLKDGALSFLYTYQVGDVAIVPILVAFINKYAMDCFLIGILVAFACKGRRNGFLETLRALIVNFGSIVAVIFCFWLPFSEWAAAPADGGNYFLWELVSRTGNAMTSILGEKFGQYGPVVGKILSGLLLAIVAILLVVLINWILKKLVRGVQKIGFFRGIDGCLSCLVYLVIGVIVCMFIWAIWYVLARYNIFNVDELFTEEATLSHGLFELCEAVISPLIQMVKDMYNGFVGGMA